MSTKVYHAKDFPSSLIKKQKFTFPDDFVEVAECEQSEELDVAFELTNHIDSPWWLNKGVIRKVDTEPRSTSVGDVVVLSDGTAYVCQIVGWKIIGNIKDSPLIFTTGRGIFDE